MNTNLQPYEQFKVDISCRKCGNKGVAIWENPGQRVHAETSLVSLEGFYERLASKAPHAIETVCARCGGIQPL